MSNWFQKLFGSKQESEITAPAAEPEITAPAAEPEVAAPEVAPTPETPAAEEIPVSEGGKSSTPVSSEQEPAQ